MLSTTCCNWIQYLKKRFFDILLFSLLANFKEALSDINWKIFSIHTNWKLPLRPSLKVPLEIKHSLQYLQYFWVGRHSFHVIWDYSQWNFTSHFAILYLLTYCYPGNTHSYPCPIQKNTKCQNKKSTESKISWKLVRFRWKNTHKDRLTHRHPRNSNVDVIRMNNL